MIYYAKEIMIMTEIRMRNTDIMMDQLEKKKMINYREEAKYWIRRAENAESKRLHDEYMKLWLLCLLNASKIERGASIEKE